MNKETAVTHDIGPLSVHDIMELLPHRFPFLMTDRLEDIVPGESAVGTKNVTIHEQFFQGQFPAQSVLPDALIIEPMAQTPAAPVMYTLGDAPTSQLVDFRQVCARR